MRPLVSVIIPAYNCEAYISKCIESILSQSYKNIEVVIVNDGSVDKTEEVIKRYEKLDKRIRYFSQKNLGPSIARNIGIENSNGEYLMFVDADDSVSNIYVEKLLNKIRSENYDIACCGYVDQSKYGVFKLNDFWYENYRLDKSKFLDCVCNGVGGVLWAKIFRKDIIIENNIRMDSKIFMSEDLIFILEYCKYSERFGAINENLYYYNRLNDNSISSKIDINYLENYILLVNKINKLLGELNVNKNKVNLIEITKVQALVNKVLVSETYRYLEYRNKDIFVKNIKVILESNFIKKYKYQFVNGNSFDKRMNRLINDEKYIKLLHFNIFIIKLRKIKDKLLRR